MATGIHVRGATELEAAFADLRKEVLIELRPALREIAEPVRREAEQLAGRNISQIGPAWGQMRIGVTLRGVYVAPKQHRRGGSPRKNLAGLLMNNAMLPALEDKQADVLTRLDVLVDTSARNAGLT